jgi:hypothetical protein
MLPLLLGCDYSDVPGGKGGVVQRQNEYFLNEKVWFSARNKFYKYRAK